MPPLTTATISLVLLQDCLGTLVQLTTGITILGVEATSNPLQAPRGKGPAGGPADLAPELRERPGHLRGGSL